MTEQFRTKTLNDFKAAISEEDEMGIVLYCDQIPESLPMIVFDIIPRKDVIKIYTLLNGVPFIPITVMGQKGGLGIPPGNPRTIPLACSLIAISARSDQSFIQAIRLMQPLCKNINIIPHLLNLFDYSGLKVYDLWDEQSPSYIKMLRDK